jgi:hypothetical protein
MIGAGRVGRVHDRDRALGRRRGGDEDGSRCGASSSPGRLPPTAVLPTEVLVSAAVPLAAVAGRLHAEERFIVVGGEQGEVDDQQREPGGDDLGREQLPVHVGVELTWDRAGVPVDPSLVDDDEKPMREG